MKTLVYGIVLTVLLLASPALSDPNGYRQALFDRFDRDADDSLSADEFGRIKLDYQAFGDSDRNRDGKLNRFEFEEAPAIFVREAY
jgi:hypothetical protein